jgi:transcriptional regulator with XRE-family HTH domain
MLIAETCRGARGLLAWSQRELADRARIGLSTVTDFERGSRAPMPSSIEAMEAAMVLGGARFTDGQVVLATPAGAPAAVPDGRPQPMVSAEDIIQWANRLGGQSGLPELVHMLVRLAVGPHAEARFPFGESVQLGGWDGECVSAEVRPYVPSGRSGWELTVKKTGIAAKADDDFDKRAAANDEDDATREATTFVFVIARRWRQKKTWAAKQRAKGIFAGVRALDVDDLVHWIAEYPTVGTWLAEQIGKRPRAGVASLTEAWQTWSRATKPPLSEAVILAGRDGEATRVYKWLKESPSVLTVQADSVEEAVAFLPAALSVLPPAVRDAHMMRAIYAFTAEAVRELGVAQWPLIIVMSGVNHGFAEMIASKGHHVYSIVGPDVTTEKGITLTRVRRYDIEPALESMKIGRAQARSLARRSGGSIATLRRIMADDVVVTPPHWASAASLRVVAAAALIGSWNDRSDADQAVLAELAGQPYADVMRAVEPLLDGLDTPFRRSATVYRRASAQDAWNALASRLTRADIEAFFTIALRVLRDVDPRFTRSDRLELIVHGEMTPKYSRELRRGIVETLNLMAMFPERAAHLGGLDFNDRVERLVEDLFDGAEASVWWSVRDDLPGLAEAAPDQFLEGVHAALTADYRPITSLLTEDGRGPLSREYISDLTSALERLAWSPDYFESAVTSLAGLAAIDPQTSRNGNRPAATLRQILLPWHPQTYAKLSQRLHVLDALRKAYPDVAWSLMLSLMPKHGFDHSSYSSTPTWRTFEADPERITSALLHESENELLRRLLEDAGRNVTRWIGLLTGLLAIAEERQREVTMQLLEAMRSITDEDEKLKARDGLRDALHRHRQFAGAGWALPESVLEPLHCAYDLLVPSNIVEREQWVFARNPTPPLRAPGHDLATMENENNENRRRVARELLEGGDAETIFAMADAVEVSVDLGIALMEVGIEPALRGRLLADALQSTENNRMELGRGMMFGGVEALGFPWAVEVVRRGIADGWAPSAIARALQGMGETLQTWALVAEAGVAVERVYWTTTWLRFIRDDPAAVPVAAAELLRFGQACRAIEFIGINGVQHFDAPLLLRALREAAAELMRGDAHADSTMFAYYTGLIFDRLIADVSTPREELVALEWTYFGVLEHSDRRSSLLDGALAASPEFFLDVVSLLYRADDDESGDSHDNEADMTMDRKRAIARQSYALLDRWSTIPGAGADGVIDQSDLNMWVDRARTLGAAAKRLGPVDDRIGAMLSAAKPDPSGGWPPKAVRDVIERVKSAELDLGLQVGACNRRGATSRGALDGGEQERDLKAYYDGLSQRFRASAPRTSKILRKLGEQYKYVAVTMDHLAEQVDEL